MNKRFFKPLIITTVILTASALNACSFSKSIIPLIGEDEKAMEYSKENRKYVEKTAAIMSFEEFVTAIRAGDTNICLSKLGPTTRALLNGLADGAGKSPAAYWQTGDISKIVLPGTGQPVAILKNRTTVTEIGKFDPSKRDVILLANVEGAGETRIRGSFVGDNWVFEFVDSVPSAPE
jgi:hypothetical protein